jgi:hypothetical protein
MVSYERVVEGDLMGMKREVPAVLRIHSVGGSAGGVRKVDYQQCCDPL